MKGFLKILWRISGTIIILIGAGFFVARMVNVAPSDELSGEDQLNVIIEQGGCLICHGGPEYYTHINWPVVGAMIQKSARTGIRYCNACSFLEHLTYGSPIDEITLIKLQKVISEASMPPLIFKITHWKSSLTRDKQKILLNWVYNSLAKDYNWPIPSRERPFEPILPIPDSLPADPAKVNLGRILYHDTRLSIDGTISCATCHNLEKGGVDNLDFSPGVYGQPGMYTTTTTLNTVFHSFFFWDGKASSLAQQLAFVLTDPVIMGNESFEEIIVRLETDKDFTSLFTETYPGGFSAESITDALAEYNKVLITPDAPFDKYLKGDSEAISLEAKKGYELFKKNGCASCHGGVSIGGKSLEYMGLANSFFPTRNKVRLPDLGYYRVTGLQSDIHKFKVPGLRNIELTYPYFHNSSATDLKIAVQAMAFHQKDKLLNLNEVRKIVSFLKTLTGNFEENMPVKSGSAL